MDAMNNVGKTNYRFTELQSVFREALVETEGIMARLDSSKVDEGYILKRLLRNR